MNRDQKAAAIAEIVARIQESHSIFAVDYRGISVPQVAELRAKLREVDASFQVVKNSLTERAADTAGTEPLKDFLQGPTALTFVRGDAAAAAKAIAEYARATQLLPFKGGLMNGSTLDAEQIRSISRLPSREALYGQLVGIVASPVSGLVRTLGGLLGGLALALGQVRDKKQAGEIPAGQAPASGAAESSTTEQPASEQVLAESSEEIAVEEQTPQEQAEEPVADEPAQDNNQADASAEQPETAEATKED
jgi:large subunit ribosomal protein L10